LSLETEDVPLVVQTEENLPLPTPQIPDVLTICLSNEPASLFIYGDASQAARTVREALYDGPYDLVGYEFQPVILEKKPSFTDGDMLNLPVEVNPGDLIVSADGMLTNLAEGVTYFPSGCFSEDCISAYSGQNSVQIDQLVVRFKLRQDVRWSDGKPLTADDTLFSYEVARALYPQVRADLLARTLLYQATDSYTIEWQGVPGYRPSSAATFFFDPLPRHVMGKMSVNEILDSETVNRQPLGYGAYQLDNWSPGEQISFSRNPLYFRASQGLPKFDKLVFRFIPAIQQATEMLQAGECDVLDETYRLESQQGLVENLLNTGELQVVFKEGTAWEHIVFGLLPASNANEPASTILSASILRSAIAQCLDRQRLVNELFGDEGKVIDQYVPADHPLANPAITLPAFDPQSASTALENQGWIDDDGDPSTPRIARGVAGLNDGEILRLSMLSANDPASLQASEVIQESLAQCGVSLVIEPYPAADLLAAGPVGKVFGRQFQMAKFAWQASPEPPCDLYTTVQIPGEYPQFPFGWGGANASGYSNPAYDRYCSLALSSLTDDQQYILMHHQTQQILADDLPFLPLYMHRQALAARRDLCGLDPDPSARSGLWNLESLELAEECNSMP
jgi:peptide/nickel transport system substrate-binding protein